MEKRLPLDILRVIKGYEYSLIEYSEAKKKIKQIISYNIYQPYYLRGTLYHMSDEGQIDYIMHSEVKETWKKLMSKKELIEYIIKVNNDARELFKYN